MADTLIQIGLFGTQTINTSGDYAVSFLGAGTLNVTGASTIANLNSIAGVGALETFNITGGATAKLNGAVSASALSSFNIGGASTLEFGSGLSSTLLSQINFTGSGFGPGLGGSLKLDAGLDLNLLNSPINGFGNASNSIDFSAVATSAAFTPTGANSGTLTLFNGATAVKTFSLAQLPEGVTSANFELAADGSGGTIVGFTCFVRGTRIATPSGQKAVEDLVVGDLVETLSGEPAPIKWIGKRAFRAADLPDPAAGMPIRIRKDAIAPNVPCADLLVSPAHCMFLENSLIPAQFLVNGVTIVQDFDIEQFEYFHIELDKHAVVIAENAPTESYLDTGNRSFFLNQGVVQLFPDFAPKSWDDACAPFVTEGPALAAAKAALLARAKELGAETTDEADLRLQIDGRDIEPISIDGAVHTFVLPLAFSDIRIVSRSSVAAEVVAAESDDRRRLGVAVGRIVLRHGAGKSDIPLDHPELTTGFHDVERGAGRMWRWSNGEALLPASLVQMDGCSVSAIDIHVRGALPAYRIESAIAKKALAPALVAAA